MSGREKKRKGKELDGSSSRIATEASISGSRIATEASTALVLLPERPIRMLDDESQSHQLTLPGAICLDHARPIRLLLLFITGRVLGDAQQFGRGVVTVVPM